MLIAKMRLMIWTLQKHYRPNLNKWNIADTNNQNNLSTHKLYGTITEKNKNKTKNNNIAFNQINSSNNIVLPVWLGNSSLGSHFGREHSENTKTDRKRKGLDKVHPQSFPRHFEVLDFEDFLHHET